MSKDFIIKILVNEIKKRDWKFLFNNFNIICFKKIISINKFDLKISLIDENKLVIKNSLLLDDYNLKNLEFLSLINVFNKFTTKGFYTLERNHIDYNLNLELKYYSFETEKDIYNFTYTILDEIENLSKNLSLGVHQLVFGHNDLNYIQNSLFLQTLGNA